MVELFDKEIILDYSKAFKSVIFITSDHALNEFMSEYSAEQSKRAEIIMQKY
jgi:hypothetical protein